MYVESNSRCNHGSIHPLPLHAVDGGVVVASSCRRRPQGIGYAQASTFRAVLGVLVPRSWKKG
jgi:hypothetical protein